MQKVDTILICRWVIPIESHTQILDNHAIIIDKGKILDLLPAEKAKTLYQSDDKQYLDDHAVLPGFVNAHTHSPMVLFKGLADDLPLMEWLNDHIWPAERKWLNNEFIEDGTELAVAEMIRNGTTCFNEHFFFPEVMADVTRRNKMRASIGPTIINFPSGWSVDENDGFAKFKTFYENKVDDDLINITLAPHAPYSVTDNMLTQINAFAQEHDLPIHMHVHETGTEVQESLEKFGKRPLKRLADLGLLSNRFQCVHMTQINDEDMALIEASQAHIIHCPESNLKLASGYSPIDLFLKKGINVALGTDGAASNNNLDMIGEMRTAALIGKTTANSASAVKATDVLRMATLNGAKALGLEDKIGSIVKGKSADLIAIDLSHFNTRPVYNPISQIVYSANNTQITDVWVEGVQLLKESEFLFIDENELENKASKWRGRLH